MTYGLLGKRFASRVVSQPRIEAHNFILEKKSSISIRIPIPIPISISSVPLELAEKSKQRS